MTKRKPKTESGRPVRSKADIAAAKGPAKSYIYTEAMGEEICRRLARGEGLKPISRTPGFPHSSTIMEWATDTTHPFSERYRKARVLGYMHMAEEIIEIADDKSGDVTMNEDGNPVTNHENIARSRLKVDTRKWVVSRMLPHIFGDRVVTEHIGPNGGAIQVDVQHRVNDFFTKIDAIARRQKELQAIEVEAEAEQERERR
jgi:hypothetical protein